MNPNSIPLAGYQRSKYVPPPPPTVTPQQIKRADTAAPILPPPPQPMLPPPPPQQPMPDDRNFWLRPMVSKEAVAGAPDWIRPVAEFATELTTPLDVALTLGTAGFGGVAATALRGGTKAIQAGRKANIFRRGLAGLVDPIAGGRARLPARIIAETGLTAGGHYGVIQGEEIGGIPGAIVGALGGGLAGGVAGVGLAKGMGKALQKAPGTRVLFEDPWSRKFSVDREDPSTTYHPDPEELVKAENPEGLGSILYGNTSEQYPFGYETQLRDPIKGGGYAKDETLESAVGRRLSQVQSPLKRTFHKLGRIIAPNYYIRNFLEESTNKLYIAEGQAVKDANVLLDWVGMTKFQRIFGITEKDFTNNPDTYSFVKYFDDDGSIIKDHPIFTEENIKKFKDKEWVKKNASGVIGVDENGKNIIGELLPRDNNGNIDLTKLSLLRLMEETKPLENNWHLKETKKVKKKIWRGTKQVEIEDVEYGDAVGVNWGEILNEEQKEFLLKMAKVNRWTGNRLQEYGIDVFNRKAKGLNARSDDDITDMISFTKEELAEMGEEALKDKTITQADFKNFQEGLTSPIGYANRKFMYRIMDDGTPHPHGEIIIVGNNKSAWKVDARIGAENKRTFTKVDLAEQAGYRYMPLDESFSMSIKQRTKRAATAAHEKWQKQMIAGYKYIDPDTGGLVEKPGVWGGLVRVEHSTERAVEKLYLDEISELGITLEEAQEKIRLFQAGEKVANPHAVAQEMDIHTMQSYMKDLLYDESGKKYKDILELSENDIKQLKNIVNYLDNVKDEEALKAAEEIRGIWADINGEDVIPVLKDIQADGLGKNTFKNLLKSFPIFSSNETIAIDQMQFAITLAHARRLMGTDYVNNLSAVRGALDPKPITREGIPSPERIKVWRYTGQYDRQVARATPEDIFVFGDNVAGVGTGPRSGQAVIRGERNAMGIPTKESPSIFWSDENLENNKRLIDQAISRILKRAEETNANIHIPWDQQRKRWNLGTGRAALEKNAPMTFRHLQDQLNKLSTFKREAVTPERVVTEFNYEGATKALKKIISDYKANTNESINIKIAELTEEYRIAEQAWKLAVKEQKATGRNYSEQIQGLMNEVTDISGRLSYHLDLKNVYSKQGAPKTLHFDGQDYIRGLSYGVHGWNPTGRGYTDGSTLDSVFQVLKETNIPSSVTDELKFIEDIIEKAYHTKTNPFDNDSIKRGLRMIELQLEKFRSKYRARIDDAMKKSLIEEPIYDLMMKTKKDFITEDQLEEGFARAAFALREPPKDPRFFRWLREQHDVDPKAPYKKDLASERNVLQKLGIEEGYMDGFPLGSDEQTWFITINKATGSEALGATPINTWREVIKFKNDMDAAMERSDHGTMAKLWLQANSMQRMVALGFDASIFNIHLLPVWFNHPQAPLKSWKSFWNVLWKAVKSGSNEEGSLLVEGFKMDPEALAVRRFYGADLYMSDSNEVFEINKKVGMPKGFKGIGKAMENAFGHSLDIAGIEMGKALMYIIDMSASPAVIRRQKKMVAQYINNMRGLSDSSLAGISPNQQNLEAMGFLAARYRRATAAIWVKAFTGEPLEKYMAQKALINLFTGLFMTTVGLQIGASALRGDSPEQAEETISKMIDPSDSSFLLFSLNNQKVGPGSKFVSDARILSKAMNFFYKSGTQKDMEDWENFISLTDDNPGLRWIRSQLGFTPSTAWDFLVGENYIGEPQFREGDGGFDTFTNFLEPFSEMIVPMWISGSVLENTQGSLDWGDKVSGMGTRGVSEFVGLRAHSQSASGILREASWDILNASYNNLEPFQKDILRHSLMEQLTPLQEESVKRGTNDFALYFNDIKRIEQEFKDELLYMTNIYPNTPEGNRNMYDRYRQLKSYTRGRKHDIGYDIEFDEPDLDETDPKKNALNKYYNLFELTRIPGTQMQDWDLWEIEYEKLMDSLTLEQQAVIARNTSRTSIPYQFLERIKYLGEAREYKRIMRAQELREIYLNAQERPDLAQISRNLYLILED